MEENRLGRAIHPPYSPNLAPSDFHLFSHVKHCLRGQSFQTADKLFLTIDVLLRDIENRTLQVALLGGIQRLRQWLEANGDCFEEVYKSIPGEISFTP
jgi:hypothetical protein